MVLNSNRSFIARWALMALFTLIFTACDGKVHLLDRKNVGLGKGDNVSNTQMVSVTSAAQYRQRSTSGYVISGSVGSVPSDLVQTGTGGWKLYGGPEGNAVSH